MNFAEFTTILRQQIIATLYNRQLEEGHANALGPSMACTLFLQDPSCRLSAQDLDRPLDQHWAQALDWSTLAIQLQEDRKFKQGFYETLMKISCLPDEYIQQFKLDTPTQDHIIERRKALRVLLQHNAGFRTYFENTAKLKHFNGFAFKNEFNEFSRIITLTQRCYDLIQDINAQKVWDNDVLVNQYVNEKLIQLQSCVTIDRLTTITEELEETLNNVGSPAVTIIMKTIQELRERWAVNKANQLEHALKNIPLAERGDPLSNADVIKVLSQHRFAGKLLGKPSQEPQSFRDVKRQLAELPNMNNHTARECSSNCVISLVTSSPN
jgi:hypothetical protein